MHNHNVNSNNATTVTQPTNVLQEQPTKNAPAAAITTAITVDANLTAPSSPPPPTASPQTTTTTSVPQHQQQHQQPQHQPRIRVRNFYAVDTGHAMPKQNHCNEGWGSIFNKVGVPYRPLGTPMLDFKYEKDWQKKYRRIGGVLHANKQRSSSSSGGAGAMFDGGLRPTATSSSKHISMTGGGVAQAGRRAAKAAPIAKDSVEPFLSFCNGSRLEGNQGSKWIKDRLRESAHRIRTVRAGGALRLPPAPASFPDIKQLDELPVYEVASDHETRLIRMRQQQIEQQLRLAQQNMGHSPFRASPHGTGAASLGGAVQPSQQQQSKAALTVTAASVNQLSLKSNGHSVHGNSNSGTMGKDSNRGNGTKVVQNHSRYGTVKPKNKRNESHRHHQQQEPHSPQTPRKRLKPTIDTAVLYPAAGLEDYSHASPTSHWRKFQKRVESRATQLLALSTLNYFEPKAAQETRGQILREFTSDTSTYDATRRLASCYALFDLAKNDLTARVSETLHVIDAKRRTLLKSKLRNFSPRYRDPETDISRMRDKAEGDRREMLVRRANNYQWFKDVLKYCGRFGVPTAEEFYVLHRIERLINVEADDHDGQEEEEECDPNGAGAAKKERLPPIQMRDVASFKRMVAIANRRLFNHKHIRDLYQYLRKCLEVSAKQYRSVLNDHGVDLKDVFCSDVDDSLGKIDFRNHGKRGSSGRTASVQAQKPRRRRAGRRRNNMYRPKSTPDETAYDASDRDGASGDDVKRSGSSLSGFVPLSLESRYMGDLAYLSGSKKGVSGSGSRHASLAAAGVISDDAGMGMTSLEFAQTTAAVHAVAEATARGGSVTMHGGVGFMGGGEKPSHSVTSSRAGSVVSMAGSGVSMASSVAGGGRARRRSSIRRGSLRHGGAALGGGTASHHRSSRKAASSHLDRLGGMDSSLGFIVSQASLEDAMARMGFTYDQWRERERFVMDSATLSSTGRTSDALFPPQERQKLSEVAMSLPMQYLDALAARSTL